MEDTRSNGSSDNVVIPILQENVTATEETPLSIYNEKLQHGNRMTDENVVTDEKLSSETDSNDASLNSFSSASLYIHRWRSLSMFVLHRKRKHDIQEQLMKILTTKDIRTFERLLNKSSKMYDVNHFYVQPHFCRLLDLACFNCKKDFVKLLLQKGADPRLKNKQTDKYPIHAIFDSGKKEKKMCDTLKAFTEEYIGAEWNATEVLNLPDVEGNTPLLYAIEIGIEECTEFLINSDQVDVNASNRNNETPLHKLLIVAIQEREKPGQGRKKEWIKIIEKLFERKEGPVKLPRDLDSAANVTTIRQLAEQLDHPKVKQLLEKAQLESELTPNTMMRLLEANRDLEFINNVQKIGGQVNWHDGSRTFLMMSCELGKAQVVKELLKAGADPNATPAGLDTKRKRPVDETALMLAAYKGHLSVIKVLLEPYPTQVCLSLADRTNVFHLTIAGAYQHKTSRKNTDPSNEQDHYGCLKYLVGNVDCKRYVSKADHQGNTPLHYAVQTGNKDFVILLLENGARLDAYNDYGEPAVTAEALQWFLDACVVKQTKPVRGACAPERSETNKRNSRVTNPLQDLINYSIDIRYHLFRTPSGCHQNRSQDANSKTQPIYETDSLLKIIKHNEMLRLLKHPVITSFLDIKWFKIRPFFLFYLVFHTLFVAVFSTYLCMNYGIMDDLFTKNVSEKNSSLIRSTTGTLLWAILLILTLMKIIEWFISFRSEVFTTKWWWVLTKVLKLLVLLGVAAAFIYKPTDRLETPLAILIYCSAIIDTIRLMQAWPKVSVYLAMLRTVAVTFLKFLLFFTIVIIIPFAFIFFLVFRNYPRTPCGAECVKEKNFFRDPSGSLFKTLVMMTGELGLETIPFDEMPVFSNFVFIVYIFIIPVVLINLLNGLAVSDTQKIKSEAQVIGYLSQIKFISYFERLAAYVVPMITCLWPKQTTEQKQKTVEQKTGTSCVSIFSSEEGNVSQFAFLRISPTESKMAELYSSDGERSRPKFHGNCKLTTATIRSAKSLIVKKERISRQTELYVSQ